MKKPRVLLDVDGVLADFLQPAFTTLNTLAGTNHHPSQQVEWDVFSLFDEAAHGPSFFRACNQRGWCRSIPVYDGAKEGYAQLANVADVYVVTSPMNHNETWTHEREAWLLEHFGIPHKRIVHTSAKFLVKGDVLIDDKPSNVSDWLEHHPTGLGLLWDQTYNRQATAGVRVTSWAEALDRLKRL